MVIIFDLEEYQLLLDGFMEYAREKLKLQPSTLFRYKVILDDYFESYVIDKFSSDDYTGIFSTSNLSLITRKSNNVRPSLTRFLEFLYHENLVEKSTYLQMQDNINSFFSSVAESQHSESEIEFLTPNEIRRLFGNRLQFKHKYEREIIPLFCSLTFFYMFKQEDMIKLKLSDIDLEAKRIKNVRYSENQELVEWLGLNKITLEYLQEYLPYRNSLGFNRDNLFVMEDRYGNNIGPLDNEKINRLFSCINRRDNALLFGNKKMYQGLLIRSMMLYILVSTKGEGLYKILLEQELGSRALEYALNEYISIIRTQNQNNIVERYNIEDILPVKKPKTVITGEYSESNDVNEKDIGDYDMNNERNLEQNKVSIQRMVRDSKIARQLKKLHKDECQLCGYKVRKSNGDYVSEAHHIQPYNRLHRGDDNSHNIIILCPNCHTQFDDLYFAIHPDTQEVHCILGEEEEYHLSNLHMKEEHTLHKKYLEYTWKLFEDKMKLLKMEAYNG